jgi:hypothetical protein
MPLVSQVKYDPVLTNVSIQYKPAPRGYLADAILPPVPVVKESAIFWVYDKTNFDIPESKRAPRSDYAKIDWTVTQDTYLAEEYGLEGEIDDEERENASAPLDLDIDTTEIITDMILNNREKRVADLVMSTGTITQNVTLTGTNQWSDYSGTSDPATNVKTARTTIFDATGYVPNKMLMGYKVFEALKLHPDILDRIKYSERAVITPAILAALFEVDEILIGGVLRKTSKEGQAVALADVWGKDCLLFYSEPRPALRRASFGYQMRQKNLRVFRYREDRRNTDVIRVTEKQDEKIVATALGYLIKAAVA